MLGRESDARGSDWIVAQGEEAEGQRRRLVQISHSSSRVQAVHIAHHVRLEVVPASLQ